MHNLIDFKSVTLTFEGKTPLFDNLTLSIEQGAFYLLQGPSGAGKTTFLRLINRLENPDSGEIRFKGKPLENYPPPQLRHSLMYIQQTPSVMDGSVQENLLLPFSFKNNHHLKKPGHPELENLLTGSPSPWGAAERTCHEPFGGSTAANLPDPGDTAFTGGSAPGRTHQCP